MEDELQEKEGWGQGWGLSFPCILGETKTQRTFKAGIGGGGDSECVDKTERERGITASACVLHVHVRVHLYFASKVT